MRPGIFLILTVFNLAVAMLALFYANLMIVFEVFADLGDPIGLVLDASSTSLTCASSFGDSLEIL